jgi:hypothetical protein
MGHPDGAHTHGGGGGDLIYVLLVLGALALAGPILAAVAELVHLVLIVVAVAGGVAAVGLVAFIAFRLRHRATEPARLVYRAHPVAQRRSQALPEPRPAIERPAEVHLHLHGLSAAEIAAIIRHGQEPS